jgi:hypothetical protein
MLPAARAVLAALAEDPLLISRRLELAIEALPGREVCDLLCGTVAGLHGEALMAVVAALRAGGRRNPTVLEELETGLSASDDERLRRIALAALTVLAEARGWTTHHRDRLAVYQADSSPLVAGAAHFVFPPPLPSASRQQPG